jgi:hypothetical protein
MPDYSWPDAEHRGLIGKRIPRVDSPAKVTGQGTYTYDVQRPGMLYGKVARCPYARGQDPEHRHKRRRKATRGQSRSHCSATRTDRLLGRR